VKNPSELRIQIHKLPLYSNFAREIFTAQYFRVAPLVCVDFFHLSVKVGCVDGRKG
jgi:hypothetical protein